MYSTADSPVAQITTAPYITLVDLDGFAVPDCERYTPTCDPDSTDPSEWPAWTDNWLWETDEITAEDIAFARRFDAAMDEFDAPDASPYLAFAGIAPLSERMALPAISGGSPETASEFIPTDADLADYAAWSAELEARREAEDFYRRHSLAEFNAIRSDAPTAA